MSALEEAQISLNEAALRWLDFQENRRPSDSWVPVYDDLKAAASAFRHLAEARGPAPEDEFPPRPDTSQQGVEWSGPAWPPEYDYSRGDTWNGRAYPLAPPPTHAAEPSQEPGSLFVSCTVCGRAVEFVDNSWSHVVWPDIS